MGRWMLAARLSVGLIAASLALFTLPSWWCSRKADAWLSGDPQVREALLEGVGRRIDAGLDRTAFSTGSRRFDGEWLYGTTVMSAIGMAQVAQERGATAQDLDRIDRCLDLLLGDDASAFDTEAWGAPALGSDDGHAAWLGYGGIAFALRQRLQPGGRHAGTADAIAEAIRTRLGRMGEGGVETYPGERYPIDQSSLVAALALHAQARGREPPPEIAAWTTLARRRFVDPSTGLLFQAVNASGAPLDMPRGSGTFLASYFLSFADPALSAELFSAGRRALSGSILGFGMMREYPRGVNEIGDIDSGPVLFGYGISSTGFALGAARAHGDEATFRRLYSTAHLFGAPRSAGAGAMRFTSGGPLGDALMFAMLTAQPAEGR